MFSRLVVFGKFALDGAGAAEAKFSFLGADSSKSKFFEPFHISKTSKYETI